MRSKIDILSKIRQFRKERNWSEYQLSELSGIPQSTISSWYRKNQIPTIYSLEKICNAFNITLAQFFTEDTDKKIQLTTDQAELLHDWNRLNEQQQEAIRILIKSI